MKLIIDIGKGHYGTICDGFLNECLISTTEVIKNGVPLDSVIEDIKAEIVQKQYDFMADKDYDEGIRFGLMLAYQIIDKHISGKENE